MEIRRRPARHGHGGGHFHCASCAVLLRHLSSSISKANDFTTESNATMADISTSSGRINKPRAPAASANQGLSI
eukprot:scaffold51153_cov51-Cyclotella_meneghiniana.AAC.3